MGYSGTATSGIDYSKSDSIVIQAGSLTGSITLTGEDNAVYTGDKTVIIDISNVTNGTENGIQKVMATILEDEPVPVSSQWQTDS